LTDPFAGPVDVQRLGVVRRLSRLATPDGFFCIAAIDHPENYLELFDADIDNVSDETVVRSKLELVGELSRHASALLLDPMWSLGQAVATRALPGSVGLIAPIEYLRYRPGGWGLDTELRSEWTPAKIAALGADAVKLFLFYRAERDEAVAAQRKLVADLVSSCRAAHLPLVVEPIWYPVDGEDPADAAVQRQRSTAIVAAAAEFALLGADILKVQFPGSVATAEARASASAAACELDAGLDVPWVLLSEGAGFDDFAVQMDITARAGASGYIAGRAIWGDAVGYRPDAERAAAVARAGERLDELNRIVRAHGRPWAPPVGVDAVATGMPTSWCETYRA